MTSHRVLITGVGGNVGQGVLKALRAADKRFHIVGIDMEPLSAGFSLVDSYYQAPRTSDPSFPDVLKSIAKKEKLEAVYVCSPSELEPFALLQDDLQRELDLTVFVNPLEVVQIGSDKFSTANFLRDAGFPYPETVLSNDAIGLRRLIEKHRFPLLAKPRKGYSSQNVFILNSQDELDAASTLIPDLVIQRYLPDPQNEFTAATVSGRDARVRATIIFHRELLQGTTYRTELVEDSKLERQVVDVVEALGAIGPCNLQFRMVDNNPYVFEINPRFSGTSGIRFHYGFNDCEMIFDLLRQNIEIEKPALRKAVVLRYWNEVCIPEASFDDLREGRIKHRGVESIVRRDSH
jgi:carbamoyl-phosphate synthase large subunit